ncbi:MAG: hypothetical protein AAFN44_07665 [Pseudomonadota bacterium]
MTTRKHQPAAKIRDGALVATIWANESENGTFYAAEFSRTYQDADGKYHDASSFSSGELLRLARLAGKVYDRIGELRSTAAGR